MSEVETSNLSTNVLERGAALTGRTFARHRSYWRERLALLDGAAREATALPLPRPLPSDVRSTRCGLTLDSDVRAALQRITGGNELGAWVVLVAATLAQVARYGGRRTVAVRARAPHGSAAGGTPQPLLIIERLLPGETLRAWLGRVRDNVTQALKFADFALEAAFPEQAEWLAALATPWVSGGAMADVPASPLVIALEDAATFGVWVEADDGRAAPVARHLAAWLSNLVDLDRTLEEVDWVRAEERALLIDTLNDTGRPYPQDGSIHGLFAGQVRARGDAVAISVAGAGGGSDVTYAELDRRANRLAHDLCQQGVGRDDRVGLVAERSVEFVVSALAILKAGAGYVPLDPEEPSERSSAMIAAARLRALIVPAAEALRQPVPGVPIIDLRRRAELIARQPDHAPQTDAVAEQLAYVMFTSGSTGTPKGVAVSHQAVLRLVCGVDYVRLGPSDVLLQAASCCFDASTFELWGALLNGARVVVLPAPRPTLDAIADAIQRERVTTAFLTTGLFHLMAVERPAALQALDQILTGGEVSSVSHVRQVRDTVRGGVLHVYGPTESTTFATCHRVSRDERLESHVPLGRPIANTRVYLLDDDLGLVPFGIPGEICIGGDGLARGYEGEAALTAERFVPDPFASAGGGRLYRTGDMARHSEDGTLEFLGRRDRQVKIRGFRIELAEVEHALSKHPAVASAAVVPIHDGRGVKRLAAFLANRGGAVDEKEFEAWLARSVPAYMVPSQIRWGDRLPLTRNGKVDYRELASRFAEGEADAGQGEPHTEVQRVLVEVWREILRVERVGIDDDFFALGGDSMLAIQMLARLHARGSSFEIQEIFEHSTIRTLAEHVVPAEPPAPSAPPSRGYCLSEVDRARLPRDIESAYPLSRLQAGTLFHTHDSSDGMYHYVLSVRLEARLDKALLTECFTAEVERQPVLRTRFDLATFSEPLQLVERVARLPVEEASLEGLDPERMREAVDALVTRERQRPFDFGQAPLIRVLLHRRSATDFQFTLVFHHAILDGWSLSTLLTTVLRNYVERLAGRTPAPLPRLGTSYEAFIALERAALADETSRRFWKETLSGAPRNRLFDVSMGDGVEVAQVSMSERVIVDIDEDLSVALHQRARQLGVPIKSVLLAAHVKVLALVGGESDVVTGVVSHGRPETSDAEQVIGLFLNTLPLRFRLKAGGFADLVRDTFAVERAALPHRRFPLPDIQKDQGRGPLFQTLFNFVHFRSYEELEATTSFRLIDGAGFGQTDEALGTTFSLDPSSRRVRCELHYYPERLSTPRALAIGRYYRRALEYIAHRPDCDQRWASLLDEEERTVLVGARPSEAADTGCLVQRIFARAARHPEAPALITERCRLSYELLAQRAEQVARRLCGRLLPDSLVAVVSARSAALVVGALGVWRAGGAYVPIDAEQPAHRVQQMLDEARPVAILIEEGWSGSLRVGVPVLTLNRAGELVGERGERAGEGLEAATLPDASPADPDQLAYAVFTSGSSGRPHGVGVSHSALCNLVAWHVTTYSITESDRATLVASTGFDASVWEMWPYLVTGAALYVPDDDVRSNPKKLLEWLRRERITVSFLPTSLAEELLRLPRNGPLDAGSLRILCTGGDRLRQRPQPGDPPLLVNHYGPTEAAVVSTAGVVHPGSGAPSIGKPIDGTLAYVLGEHLELVPRGVAGELCIAGAGLARGYLHQAALTAERFIPDPFSAAPGARLYRTGDIVRSTPDGELEFIGRADQQLKVRGHRIEPREIEAAFKAAAPEIVDVVVVAHQDGSGEKSLTAFLVAPSASADDVAKWRQSLAERLPSYMMPAAIVPLDALPVSANGKLDYGKLAGPSYDVEGTPFVAPVSAAERELAEIWAGVLGLERVGLNDDFLALGGDSILSIQVAGRAAERGIRVHPRMLFERRTLAAVARAAGLDRSLDADQGPIEGEIPLGPIQKWFFERGLAAPHVYNQAFLLDLQRPVSAEILREALRALLQHHDMLRSRFVRRDGVWVQECAREVEAPLLAYHRLEADGPEAWTRALIAESERVQTQFELARAPLFGGALFENHRLGQRRLLLWAHHLVIDVVSWRILIEDLERICERLETGQTALFARKTSSFRQWVERALVHAESPAVVAQRAYWLANGGDGVARIPLDRTEGANTVETERAMARSLDADTTRRLLQEVTVRQRASLEVLLLAAVARNLGRRFGMGRLRLAMEGHGREEIAADLDLSRLVGWFTAMYPLCLDLPNDQSLGAVIASVKDQMGAVPERGIGYGLLRYLGSASVQRELAAQDVPEVSFNYTGQFDSVLGRGRLLAAAPEPVQGARGRQDARPHLLDVMASVRGGCLRVVVLYSEARHSEQTVAELMDAIQADLQSLTDTRRRTDYESRDFPNAKLSKKELNQLIGKLQGRGQQ